MAPVFNLNAKMKFFLLKSYCVLCLDVGSEWGIESVKKVQSKGIKKYNMLSNIQ